MSFCSWCKLIRRQLHTVNLKDENLEQFSFSQQWVESCVCIVQQCYKLALIVLFLDFYFCLLTEQCSKHEFVTEACAGWKERDTDHALLRWGKTGNT